MLQKEKEEQKYNFKVEKNSQTEKLNTSNIKCSFAMSLATLFQFHDVVPSFRSSCFVCCFLLHESHEQQQNIHIANTMDGLRAIYRIACDAGEVH